MQNRNELKNFRVEIKIIWLRKQQNPKKVHHFQNLLQVQIQIGQTQLEVKQDHNLEPKLQLTD